MFSNTLKSQSMTTVYLFVKFFSSGLTVGGALFFGIGLILILICLLLCMHACFVLYVKDQGTQTQAVSFVSPFKASVIAF